MSGAIWIPALVVLAIGLGAGLLFAARVRRSGGAGERESAPTRDELVRADLEARRDDLYERLREAEVEGAGAEERESLETAAANVLRELDELKGSATGALAEPSHGEAEASGVSAVAGSRNAPAQRRAGLSALLIGAGIVAVVALLIYWAVRDAKPDPQQETAAPQQMPNAEMAHQGIGSLPPDVAIRLAGLESRLEADPTDLAARKELAILFLQAGEFFEAYKHSDELLRLDPADPDGLYVQGIVRMTMGQDVAAAELLDGVLANFPDHVLALLARGILFYRSGEVEEAIGTWEHGLQVAGGHHDDIEEMLAMARSGGPPPTSPTGPSAVPMDDGSGFRVRVELSPELVRAVQGGVLFVSLLEEDGMPPVAVRRVAAPQFPLEVVLTDRDSMVGDPLPETGLVRVRWDEDGDASSRGDLDLVGDAEADRGAETRVRLSAG